MVLVDRPDAVARQTFPRRERRRRTLMKTIQSAPDRSDPDVAVSVFEDRADVVARESFGNSQRHKRSLPEPMKSSGGADPEVPQRVLAEGENRVVDEAVLRRQGCKPAVSKALHPAIHGARPEIAVVIDEQRDDRVAGESFLPAVRFDLSAGDAVETVAGRDPDAARAVTADRGHLIVGEPLLCRPDAPSASRETIHAAAARADPHRTGAVLEDGAHFVVGKAVFGRQDLESIPLATGDAAAKHSDPECSLVVLGETADDRVGESLRRAEPLELAASIPNQTSSQSSDPEVSISGLEQRGDVGALELGSVLAVENRESNTVEAGEGFLRADPKVAVSRRRDRADRGLRQPLPALPYVDAELRQLAMRIQTENRR